MTIEIKPAPEIADDRPQSKHRGRTPRYPFRKMRVGDAFILPADHFGSKSSKPGRISRVAAAAHQLAFKDTDYKFRTSRQSCGGVRVERVPV